MIIKKYLNKNKKSSFNVGLKICVITAGIKKYKSIIGGEKRSIIK